VPDAIKKYLRAMSARLRLDRAKAKDIAKELETHLTDSTADYLARGFSMEESRGQAIKKLGDPKDLSRTLNMIHGFGRYSERPWIDALLGSVLIVAVPLGYWLLQNLVPILEPFPPIGALLLVAVGVSLYAYKAAVPAWTVTWLGVTHLLVLAVVYLAGFLGAKAFGGGALASHLVGMAAACIALFVTTTWFARRHLELTLLFLLPLTLPFIVVGYEDIPLTHGRVVLPIIGIFWVAFAFFYLLTRNRHPFLFAILGFVFYTGLYADIVIHSPSPFNASGLPLIVIVTLLHILPLMLISSPALYYLKRRT
jgi:hypothetical protein